MDMFGWFTVDRLGYDRRYGVVDDKWHRFAARWNLFHRSHVDPMVACATAETTPIGADPHRDDNANGTEDECEAVGRGSRCDEFRGECTIPMRDRQVRTIAWHVNGGFSEDLFEGTAAALDGWSEAIRVALVAGRLAECRRTGEPDCEAQMGWPARWSDDWSPPLGNATAAEVPKIFVLCHNPVDPAKGDPPECGEAGTAPRLGDLRYNFVNVIAEYQETAPWGIMVDAEDPLTGEKIAGSVNEWGHVLDRAASTLVDLLALLNGQVGTDEFIEGQNVSDWLAANKPGGSAERGKAMSPAELASRRDAVDPSVIGGYLEGLPLEGGKKNLHPAMRRKARLEALSDAGRLGPGNAELTARASALRGTAIEAAMVSPEMVQAAGHDPNGPITAEVMRRASPFDRMNPGVRRNEQRRARVERARRHSCRMEGPEPDNLLGLARIAAQRFPAPDPNDKAAVNAHQQQVYTWARQQYSAGVMAHEFGHSVGLRHNFAASFDSLNYRAGYWQLRTNNGVVTEDCEEGSDGESCIGPRWRDPLADYEIAGNIGQYSTTSVMDYPGDQNHDTLLQGKYDRAAMRFGYGGVVDVWARDGVSVTGSGSGQQQAWRLTGFAVSPGLFGVIYFPDPVEGYVLSHYSRYAQEFGLIENCASSSAADAVLGHKCQEAPMDVVDYRDMRDWIDDPDYSVFDWAVTPKVVDPAGRVRRGYMFSSDEYADSGNVPSFSYDAGADAYEQVRFLEAGYENRYILDAFRRRRVQFNSWDVTARIQSHYLDNIQQIAKTFAFAAVLEGDPTEPGAGLFEDGYYAPLQLGGTVALDLFARILTRPEPGFYCLAGNPDCASSILPLGVESEIYAADGIPLPEVYPDFYDFAVHLGEGRYVHNDYDYSQGYWWSDYQTQVGSYYEKIWATYYLAEAYDYFLSNSKQDFTDGRYKNVNFMTVFPNQVRRLYGSLLTGELDAFAPWMDVGANTGSIPEGTLAYPSWHALDLDARPGGVKLIDPNYAWNEQIYAMVWGAMYFPTNWSQSWVHDARIVTTEADAPWTAAETYAFHDPASGITYRTRAAGTDEALGRTRQYGVGARMLEWANRLVAQAWLVEVDGDGAPVYNADGTAVLLLDAAGKPQKNPANPGAAAVLERYVDNIDTMSQLAKTFEQPLTDWDLPQP
jgi:hypothetical protein